MLGPAVEDDDGGAENRSRIALLASRFASVPLMLLAVALYTVSAAAATDS